MAYDLKAALKLTDEFSRPLRDALRMFDEVDRSMSEIERNWRDVDRSSRQARNEMRRFGDETNSGSREVADLEREMEQMRRELDRASDGAGDLGRNLDDAGGVGKSAAGKIGKAFAVVGGVIATAFAIDKIKDFAGSAIEAAAEAAATSAQFSEVFGDLEGDATKQLQAIGDEASILENRMKGSFTKIAAFAKVGGMDTAESLDLADRSMRLIADSAAFYDRSLEDVTESLQSFLKGNFENDAALGLSATETTRNAAAVDLYGKKFIELDEAQKQLTLLQMVEDANEVSGAFGQAARESEGWENVMGNMTQAWTDFKAVIGEPILEVATEALVWLTEALGDLDAETMAEGLRAAFDMVRDTFNEFMSSPGMVFLTETLPEVFESVKSAVEEALASDVVTSAIEGFMGYFESLQEYGQMFWDFIVSMGPGVMVVFEDLWQALGPIFDGLTTAFRIVGDIVKVVFENIVLPLLKLVWGAFQILWGIVSPILQLLGAGIEITFAILEQIWKEIVKPILTWIGDTFEEMYERAEPVLEGISTWLGLVRDAFSEVAEKTDEFVEKIKNIQIPEWLTSGFSTAIDWLTPDMPSFATGLERVPYDGMVAELHRDESVLTADQSNMLRGLGVLQSNGDRPVLNTNALQSDRPVYRLAKETRGSGVSVGNITINGHNKPTSEIAREIVDQVSSRIAGGALA